MTSTTQRSKFTFYCDAHLRAALIAIKMRDGIPEAEQIRRAVAQWVEAKGVMPARPKKRTVGATQTR
jgi:hypothetical protein